MPVNLCVVALYSGVMKKSGKIFIPAWILILFTVQHVGAQSHSETLTRAMQLYGSEHIPARPPYDRQTIAAQRIKCINTFSKYNYDSPQWQHSDSVLSAYCCFDSLGRLTETYNRSYAYKNVLTYGQLGLMTKATTFDGSGRPKKTVEWIHDKNGRLLTLEVRATTDYGNTDTLTQVIEYDDHNLRVKIKTLQKNESMTYGFNAQGEVCETLYLGPKSERMENKRTKCEPFQGQVVLDPYRLEPCNKTLLSYYRLKKQTNLVNEQGEKLTRMTWGTKSKTAWGLTGDSATYSKTIDEKGHCLVVEEVQYNGDSVLTSTQHHYNQLGQLTETKMYFSKAWSAYEDSFKSQQSTPQERHEHIFYTYYPWGMVKSKCTLYKEQNTTTCENVVAEYY